MIHSDAEKYQCLTEGARSVLRRWYANLPTEEDLALAREVIFSTPGMVQRIHDLNKSVEGSVD